MVALVIAHKHRLQLRAKQYHEKDFHGRHALIAARKPLLLPLREKALLLQVLNALLSEGQEKTLNGAPLHSSSQFHAIEQVFRHITNIERSNVFGW